MWVQVEQKSLHIGLQHIAAGLPVRAISPILSGVKIKAGVRGLILTSCNTTVTLEYVIPRNCNLLKIHREGSTVIPARFLMDIIRSFTGGMVTLKEVENRCIHIESGNSVYRLSTMNPSEFPDMLSMEGRAGFSIENEEFKKMVKQVTFAAATSESKMILTGVSCQTDGRKLKLVATDGIRLAARTANLIADTTTLISSVVIPSKHLSDYSKMLTDDFSTTHISLGDHSIHFNTTNFSMQSLLIQGTFPSIERLVPKDFSTEIKLETAPFLRAVQRVCLLAGDTHVIGLRILSAEVELFARAAEVGDVSEHIEIQEAGGEPLTTFFNGKYMRDILLAIDSIQFCMRFTGKEKPIIIQPATSLNAIYIVTPVRNAY